jgi:hypothetical protein
MRLVLWDNCSEYVTLCRKIRKTAPPRRPAAASRSATALGTQAQEHPDLDLAFIQKVVVLVANTVTGAG